ncbi:MAG: hypothetical protein JKX78_16195 [Alteromonadaceae bacterium]|nr:hypothetical protein [Alteromonadaceae bacterium]
MKIFIITDGNNQLGMGHIYQSMTLVGYLLEQADYDLNITFITKSDHCVISLLKSSGCNVVSCKNDNEIFNLLASEKPDRIIFDKLDVSPLLAKKIKQELTAKLLIFTNLTTANDHADVAILADIGSNFENIFIKNKDTGQIKIYGPKYWLIRPEFFLLKSNYKKDDSLVKNIMLIFGGADPANLSSIVLDELLTINIPFKISIVLGAAFQHQKELDKVIKSNGSLSTINIYRNVTNIAEMMSINDLVLASPGLSFFESLVVGTPVIGFHQDSLQQKTYKDILPTVDKKDIDQLSYMITNNQFIFPHSSKIKKMAIGEGKDQIIQEILLKHEY